MIYPTELPLVEDEEEQQPSTGLDTTPDNREGELTLSSGEGDLVSRSGSTASSSSKQRWKHTITVSAVIKLDYDTSDPVYTVIRQLILKYVLRWILPGYHSNRPGTVQPRMSTPSPSVLLPLEEMFVPKGPDLMRDTWFTSRDNVNLLFEIFHKVCVCDVCVCVCMCVCVCGFVCVDD